MIKKNGFTLLELLVVIGIIGILLALITVSFTSAQRQSRDSRRRQDLAAIQNALEQYYSENSFSYPVCVGDISTVCSVQLSGYFSGGIPTDPLGTNEYTIDSSSTQYTVTAIPEKCDPPAAPCPGISVTNLQ